MRKIILASQSKARQRILRQLGLKFQVMVAKAEESRKPAAGCSRLVVANACAKAREIAARLDSGVVIGADTVILAGRKIIGKPGNKKQALEILKFLSRNPTWVYTGLAVIDIDRDKTFTAHQKTRIYLRRLSRTQIRNYLKRASGLDKAGGFDIQNSGDMLIERIEGCFYNVAGLPLSQLAAILKKTGIDIF